MANGKKSFIAYVDWKETFDSLPDEKAGILIKHLFAYVNDENPETDDILIKAVFANIKHTLKRDLKKYEAIKVKRSESGKMGGIRSGQSRKQNEANEANDSYVKQNEANEAVSDNDNDSVNVIDNDNKNKEYKRVLLSEIDISDYPLLNDEYILIAKSFQELFKHNLIEAGAVTANIDKAKGTWVDDIRLTIETDGYTKEDLRGAYEFLKNDAFWKKNILSTRTLREKMDKIKLNIKNNGKSGRHNAATNAELAGIVSKYFASDGQQQY